MAGFCFTGSKVKDNPQSTELVKYTFPVLYMYNRIVVRPASFMRTVDCPSMRCLWTHHWMSVRRETSKDSTRKQELEKLRVHSYTYMYCSRREREGLIKRQESKELHVCIFMP